jgi:Flp pilus assembly pilin Flp
MLALWNYLTCSLKARLGDEKGATAIEYTLLLVLVALVMVAIGTIFTPALRDAWDAIIAALEDIPT